MGFLISKIKQLAGGREVLEMKNSVNFAMITLDSKMILASQKRAGNDELETLNCFGGYIEDGDDALKTVFKELYEEANIKENDVLNILSIYQNKKVSVGYTTEESNLYIIVLNKTSQELDLKCNDENESISIRVVDLSFQEINRLMDETNCLKFYIVLEKMFNLIATRVDTVYVQ